MINNQDGLAIRFQFLFAITPAGRYLQANNLDFYISWEEGRQNNSPIVCVVSTDTMSTQDLAEKLNNDLELSVREMCPYPIYAVDPD